MKKVFGLIICLVFLLTSCNEYERKEQTPYDREILNLTNSNSSIDIYVYRFKYRNHKYILFSKGHGKGVIHDPDCECFEDNNVKETIDVNEIEYQY